MLIDELNSSVQKSSNTLTPLPRHTKTRTTTSTAIKKEHDEQRLLLQVQFGPDVATRMQTFGYYLNQDPAVRVQAKIRAHLAYRDLKRRKKLYKTRPKWRKRLKRSASKIQGLARGFLCRQQLKQAQLEAVKQVDSTNSTSPTNTTATAITADNPGFESDEQE